MYLFMHFFDVPNIANRKLFLINIWLFLFQQLKYKSNFWIVFNVSEQEVPQTPIKRDVSAKKSSHLKTGVQDNNRTQLVSRREESREINLFHGDDIFG